MDGGVTLAKNVMEFLNRAAPLVGCIHEEDFSQDMFANCLDIGMQSPIEHLLWIALHAAAKSTYTPINPDWVDETGYGHGLHVRPQEPVGKFQIDFGVRYQSTFSGSPLPFAPVAVELDGHDFHDKDKRQRSYEKGRDRQLVAAGFKVLHYTGSDVVADPFKIAFEVMVFAGMKLAYEYDPQNPLGIE